jgi:hypothetical protein
LLWQVNFENNLDFLSQEISFIQKEKGKIFWEQKYYFLMKWLKFILGEICVNINTFLCAKKFFVLFEKNFFIFWTKHCLCIDNIIFRFLFDFSFNFPFFWRIKENKELKNMFKIKSYFSLLSFLVFAFHLRYFKKSFLNLKMCSLGLSWRRISLN